MRARVVQLDSLSAHADGDELIARLASSPSPTGAVLFLGRVVDPSAP